MQATDTFKTIIENHLQKLGEADPLFAETLKKPKKNINDCVTYILNQVKKSGQVGYADEEIFQMAVHYYDEDNIEVGKPVSARVVVNQHIESQNNNVTVTSSVASTQQKAINKKADKKAAAANQDSLF